MGTWWDPTANLTISVGETPTAAKLNKLRDDLLYLYNVTHTTGATVVPAAVWSTSSTTYVDWNGSSPCSVAFTKRGGTETQLWITVIAPLYFSAGAIGTAQYAVSVGGTDYSTGVPAYVQVNNTWVAHTQVVSTGGIVSGAYVCKLRVKVNNSGFTYATDGNGYAQIIVNEINAT